jgi:hypothetical protein
MKIDDEYDDPYVVGRITQLENIANTVPMFSGTVSWTRIVTSEERLWKRIEELEDRVKSLENLIKKLPIDKMKVWGPP